jgi:hypothetical protein
MLVIRDTVGSKVEELLNKSADFIQNSKDQISLSLNKKKTELKNKIFYAKI